MKEANEIWKNFWMVKSFQHERRRVKELKNVREIRKDGKRCNKRNGVLRTGG